MQSRLRHLVAPVVAGAVIALLVTGCSSFNSDFKAQSVSYVSAYDIKGPWEGTWRSEVSQHHGELRCLVTARADGKYDARFQAKFWKHLSFRYTAVLEAQKSGESWKFQGQSDLGKLAGGVFRYDGEVTPAHFFSKYESKKDHGIFEMKRPTP